MKITVKQFEVWCGEYSERWNKKQLWDSYCLVKDAWLNGYYKAREVIEANIDRNELIELSEIGEQKIEVEVGSNQIGQNLPPFSIEQFKKQMNACHNCTDLRVDETNGMISFQGTFKI